MIMPYPHGTPRRTRNPGSYAKGKGGRRLWEREQHLKRVEEERASRLAEASEQHRRELAAQPQAYAEHEKARPLPRKGTPQRAALVSEVIRLRQAGKTFLDIEIELNINGAWALWKEGTSA